MLFVWFPNQARLKGFLLTIDKECVNVRRLTGSPVTGWRLVAQFPRPLGAQKNCCGGLKSPGACDCLQYNAFGGIKSPRNLTACTKMLWRS